MNYRADTVEEYIEQLPEERKVPVKNLRKTILANLPKGFEEGINYNMIGYYVPHSKYPDGYHCNPKDPLPFMNVASQKNFIALYNMGIYADEKILNWFTEEYPKHCKYKLDIGKSCIRFKKMDDIPYTLIGELVSKITPEQWISTYESVVKNSRKKQ